MAAIATEMARRGGRLRSPIGVATTGIVQDGCLTALNPGTLPIEDGFPLVAALEDALDRPVVALNDAQAAAWGERLHGAGRDWPTFAFVTVSTGVGGGLVVGGRLQVGLSGLAGHLGHMVYDPSGAACGCGRQGCIEAVASGTAIARLATERLGRPVRAPEVFGLAAAGNADAERVLDGSAMAIASGLGDLVAAIDAQGIVLGGGVGLAEGFVERVDRALVREPMRFRRPILRASCGADAGLIGAAALACLHQ
ncbi:N-acylmannosamine kinase [Rubellimicrobium aerolatum]|nr:N-acylmannosamine kinase [Rubellimicrobium aerolatum]